MGRVVAARKRSHQRAAPKLPELVIHITNHLGMNKVSSHVLTMHECQKISCQW